MEFTRPYMLVFISVILCGSALSLSRHRFGGRHSFGWRLPCLRHRGCHGRGFGGHHGVFMRVRGPVEQSCVDYSEHGNCEFFNCFSRRFPGCSRGTDLLGNCERICHNFNLKRDQLTETGQRWLNDSRACVMRDLRTRYRTTNMYRCHEMKQAIIDTMLDCMDNGALCEAFRENLDGMVDVFRGSGRSPVSFSMGIFRKLRPCDGSLARDMMSRMSEDWLRLRLYGDDFTPM